MKILQLIMDKKFNNEQASNICQLQEINKDNTFQILTRI